MARTIRSSKAGLRTLGVAAASAVLGLGCNAILGIDKGHLVKADAGSGGSESVDSGSGGSRSPDAGSGGVPGTGGQGTGGTAGTGAGGASGGSGQAGQGGGRGGQGGQGGADGGGPTGPADVPGEVHCGDSSCKLPGQACCVAISTSDAHCAASCDSSTQVRFACDGAEDCASGSKCCYPTGAASATCMATCVGRVFCGSDHDCAPGQYCAPGSGALASVFVCTDVPKTKSVWCAGAPCGSGKSCCYDKITKTEQCSASCGPSDVAFACDGSEDCAAGSVCCETQTGLGLFTGTACVSGSCPSGHPEVTCGGANGCTTGTSCCLQGTGSGCAASCSAGTVCATDADCATGETCSIVTDSSLGKPTGRSVCVAAP
jgi:hypothetical protein